MIYEQSLISKKEFVNGFSVERNYINSKEYHDKFEKLPLSKPVIESLYKETGRLLEAVDGQEQEHMLAINARTGEPAMTVIFLQLFPLKSRLQKSTNGHIITLGSNLIPILQRHWLPSCSMMKIKNIHYLT